VERSWLAGLRENTVWRRPLRRVGGRCESIGSRNSTSDYTAAVLAGLLSGSFRPVTGIFNVTSDEVPRDCPVQVALLQDKIKKSFF